MTRRCGVCGFETEDAVCPRCNTILLHGQAICPRCGKLFPGWMAVCDACGASMGPPPEPPTDEEAVRLLTSVPGISRDRARALVARGFRDVSDLVRLALPEPEIRRGLHHTIARHMLLSDLLPGATAPRSGDRCPICGGVTHPGEDGCATCGFALSPVLSTETGKQEVEEAPEEIIALAQDRDVREMPEPVWRELLDTFRSMGSQDLLRDQYRRQVDAWRAKGFDVDGVETLLATDLDGFRERSVRLIRAQALARSAQEGTRCPLCDFRLPPAARLCENCGARVT